MSRSFVAGRRNARLSPEITAAWRRFLRHAEKAGRDPVGHGQPFGRAAKRAGKLPLPPSQNGKGTDLVDLIRLGKAFAALSDPARREAAPEVARLAVACRPLFEAVAPADDESPDERVVEPRKDIFG